jgi:hypothetical protein
VKLLLIVILSFYLSAVTGQTFVQVNGVSLHDQSGFNGLNYGAGIEQTVAKQWSVAAGWYYNSEYRNSTYAYGRYAVWQSEMWNVGVAVGAVTGYQSATVLPMAFPEACYGWGCAMFVPKVHIAGANVLGFRLRIPIN